MTDVLVIDSAAWTGRTVEGRMLGYIGRSGAGVLWGWRERDLPMGEMMPTYGMRIGLDLSEDARGVFLYWGYRRFAWAKPNRRYGQ